MIDPKQHAVIFEQSYNLPDNRQAESIRMLDLVEQEHEHKEAFYQTLFGHKLPAFCIPVSAAAHQKLAGRIQ